MADTPHSTTAGAIAAWIVGGVLALIGMVLIVGGGRLIVGGGSWYYLLAGLGLAASGGLIAMRRLVGAAIYLAVYVATVIWALWEVGLAGWPLVPRLVAPTVLLFAVAALLPVLGWRRWRSAWLGVGAVAGWSLLAALVIGITNQPGTPGELPDETRAMADASLMAVAADWPAYGGSNSARRYSPLTQINRENVDDLERVWTYRTGDTPEDRWGAETTPIKVGNVVYLCSSRNILIALAADTGQEIWRHDPAVADEYIPYTAACRGVAYFDSASLGTPPEPLAAADPGQPGEAREGRAGPTGVGSMICATRIVVGTLDGRIIAVDARTGRPCPDFGDNGSVSITQGMGNVEPGYVSITSAPIIVRGVIVTGHQVLDGQRNDAPSGVVQGFDAITGELAWAWDLGNPQLRGLPPEGETFTPGTPNMWTTASADEALGLVYLPLGNSASDYWSSDRSAEENRWATSLVALDVTTGEPAWSFQTVYNDVWDYDLGSTATLIDFPGARGTTPALVLPSKQGDIYVLDRRTGEPLIGVEERPAPSGGVEPGMRSRTQPFSLFHTLARPRLTERDMWGMSPIDQMICRIQFREAAYDGIYTPPTSDRRWIQYPGYNGGSDWGGVAVDPVRGLIIANYNDTPNFNRLAPRREADEQGWFPRGHEQSSGGGDAARGGVPGTGEGAGDPQAGVPYAIDVNAGWRMPWTGMLCKEPPYGGIRAIDIRTGRAVWDRPLGTARRNGPFGIPSMLPFDIGTPNNGGAVVTGGGLIFIAAATDNLIRAIDIETGETIWSDVLPAGGQANPMVYEEGGRQFLVIMAGGHHFMETPPGDYLVAYALPIG